MNPDSERAPREEAFEAALQWRARLLFSDAGRPELDAWLAESPVNIEEALEAACLCVRISGLTPKHWAQIETLAQELAPASVEETEDLTVLEPPPTLSIVPSASHRLEIPHPQDRRRSYWSWLRGHFSLARAAILATVVFGGMPIFRQDQAPASLPQYMTSVGEHRIIALEDGSVVHLNASSHISVELSAARRAVRLHQGEALFTVAHDDQHPFEVEIGSAVIRDVGTAFDVYRETSNMTRVTVVAGEIEVWPARKAPARRMSGEPKSSSVVLDHERMQPLRLHANEQATVRTVEGSALIEQMERRTLSQDEVARQLAWQYPVFFIDGKPLRQVVAELSRVTATQFVLDPALSDIRLGGAMSTPDVDEFVELLRSQYGVKVTASRNGDGIRTITLSRPSKHPHRQPHASR
jgi:transmembrane sensor